jgi:hypothetical protein
MNSKSFLFSTKIRESLWSFGTLFWIFVIIARSIAILADGVMVKIEILELFTISVLGIAWRLLKPEHSGVENISTLKYYNIDSGIPQHEAYQRKAEARMLQIARYHLITQEYILPIPYLCQIYHLLNLKHLESVHSFSLSNLRVTQVSQFEATESGGVIKFQTVLDSSLNILKVFRQPIVEVELTLHTPYTIELNVPVYSGRRVMIVFNVLPLSNNEHKLFIDIYSDLELPRLILQTLFHCAASLTLLEDLPYLHKLAGANIQNFKKIGKSNHKMMQLFNRFVELYGSSLQDPPSLGGVELRSISGS